MAGNKLGGIKAALTNKEKHGDDFYRNIGRKGGTVSKRGRAKKTKIEVRYVG